MARFSFSSAGIDTTQRSTDFTPLPNGIYRLEITESKLNENTVKKSVGLKLAYDVLEPEEYKGRKIFTYINIENASAKAQEIGQIELARLSRACGLKQDPEDDEDLKLLTFTAKVGMGKPSDEKNADGTPQWPAKNEVKEYYFPDEGDVPAAKVTTVAAPANDNRAAPANDNKPAPAKKATPWAK